MTLTLSSNELDQSQVTSLTHFQRAEQFPTFSSGDVFITTGPGLTPKRWQLQSTVLVRHSPWFAAALVQPDPINTTAQWYQFTLQADPNNPESIQLVRQSAQGDCPEEEGHISVSDNTETANIKLEDAKPTVNGVSTLSIDLIPQALSPDLDIDTSYFGHIFGTFYNIPPPVLTAHIGQAVVHSERLVKAATYLNAMHLVRAHIGNMLSSFRHQLLTAIQSDPARWINLAIALENRAIYDEAFIHLVGAHPAWPSDWFTSRTALPPQFRQLIAKKSAELDTKCVDLDRDLLLNTIITERGKRISPLNGGFETWAVIQVYRDFIANELLSMSDTASKRSLRRGAFYRVLHKGHYLATEKVRAACEEIRIGEWEELGADLNILKEFAASAVGDMAKNELMLDVDSHEIGYLTCVKVEEQDIWWQRVTAD